MDLTSLSFAVIYIIVNRGHSWSHHRLFVTSTGCCSQEVRPFSVDITSNIAERVGPVALDVDLGF